MSGETEKNDALKRLEATVGESGGEIRRVQQELRGQAERLKESVDTLTADLDAPLNGIDSIAGMLDDMRRSIGERLRAGAEAEEEIESIATALAERRDMAQKRKDHITKLDKKVEAFLAELDSANDRIAELEQELQDKSADNAAQQRIAELETELRGRAEAIENAGIRAQEIEEQLAEARQATRQVEQDAVEGKKLEGDLRGKLRGLQEQLQSANDVRERLTARVEVLESEAGSLRGELEARPEQEQLDELQRDLDAERERAETQADGLRKELEARPAPEQLDELQKEFDAERKRAEIAETQLQDENAKGGKSALARQLAEALEDLERANREIATLRTDLKGAKPEVASEGRELLGNILLGAGDITRENLNLALEAQKKDPQQRLGKILIDMDFATAEAVARALALQVKVHFVRLGESNVDKDAATLINARIAKKHTCIPIGATESVVTLAMASPFDLIAIEDVERATEREVEIVVTIASDIDAAIERLLGEA